MAERAGHKGQNVLLIEKAYLGGGVIDIEFASFFSSLGVKVDVIEMLDEIIPFMDRGLAKRFRAALKGKADFNMGCRVVAIEGHNLKYVDPKGDERSINADIVLMSVGRSPNLSGMGFEEARLDFDCRGIKTDDQMRTNLPNVYAIGDVTGKSHCSYSAPRLLVRPHSWPAKQMAFCRRMRVQVA